MKYSVFLPLQKKNLSLIKTLDLTANTRDRGKC